MDTAARGERERRGDPTRVELGADFLARLERFAARAAALRGRVEAGSGTQLPGRGTEFEGHRPYRPGEDLRDLDWELLGRLERPFVRVRRAERGERWALLLDTSASMGLGSPGKLQLAAESATALAFAGLRCGARSELLVHGEGGGVDVAALRKRPDLNAWLALLGTRRASGRRPLRELLAAPRLNGATRVVVLGDLLDLEAGDLLALVRPGRSVAAARILAGRELSPGLSEGVEWLDPESGERLSMALDTAALEAYGRALEARLGLWRTAFARRGQQLCTWRSDASFEDVAGALLR